MICVNKMISNLRLLNWLSVGIFALMLLPMGNAAFALTLVNRTSEMQWVWVQAGINLQDIFLEPAETVTVICESGCFVTLPGWEEIEFEGTETLAVTPLSLKIVK